MHFYQFNIGDYAKKTQHLTNEEDLAYRRLLDMYYDTENPVLTTGLATLSRRLRVSEESLKNVLDEFFPDGKNKHADEVIAEYYTYLNRQKLNGSKGGRPKTKPAKPTANPVVSQNNPVPSQPITNNQEPSKPPISPKGDERFERFWQAYPRKVGKEAAKTAWGKAHINGEFDQVLAALEKQKNSAKWHESGGDYIPYPQKWLKEKRWLDEEGRSIEKIRRAVV